MDNSIKGSAKSRFCALAPLLLILLLLILLLVIGSVQETTYREVDITPELCRRLIREDFAERGQTLNAANLEIIDMQKVDDSIIVGFYYPGYWPSDFYFMQFRPYHSGYSLYTIRSCYNVDIPELAKSEFMTNFAVGSDGPTRSYYVFLSQAENLRRVELEDNYQPAGALEVAACPAMLIIPEFRPENSDYVGQWHSRYSFLDETGTEIAFLDVDSSYSIKEIS